MALTYNIRPGWRVAQIDRSRFYATNDSDYEASAQESGKTFRTREAAEQRVTVLNAKVAA